MNWSSKNLKIFLTTRCSWIILFRLCRELTMSFCLLWNSVNVSLSMKLIVSNSEVGRWVSHTSFEVSHATIFLNSSSVTWLWIALKAFWVPLGWFKFTSSPRFRGFGFSQYDILNRICYGDAFQPFTIASQTRSSLDFRKTRILAFQYG